MNVRSLAVKILKHSSSAFVKKYLSDSNLPSAGCKLYIVFVITQQGLQFAQQYLFHLPYLLHEAASRKGIIV